MSMLLSMEIKPEKVILVEGQELKGKITVNKVVSSSLMKGTIVDSEIREMIPLKDTIMALIKANNIKTKKVALTLDIGNMLIRDFEVPTGKPDEIAGMVKSEMIQSYSAAASDVIQFKKIGETEEDGAKKVKVRASALSMQIVYQFHDLIKALKLTPFSMDSNANAMEKIIGASTEINGTDKNGGAFIILDFGQNGTVLHAVHDGTVQLSRFTALGLSDMNEYISSKVNHFGEHGEYLGAVDFEEEEPSEVNEFAKTFITQWCNEIQKVIKFILLRLDTNEISRIYLAGDACQLPGITKIVSEKMYIPAECMTSLSAIQFKREEDKATLYQNVNAIGALIRL